MKAKADLKIIGITVGEIRKKFDEVLRENNSHLTGESYKHCLTIFTTGARVGVELILDKVQKEFLIVEKPNPENN